jgi:hypothetical protein
MQKLPLFSWILMRNEGKNRSAIYCSSICTRMCRSSLATRRRYVLLKICKNDRKCSMH